MTASKDFQDNFCRTFLPGFTRDEARLPPNAQKILRLFDEQNVARLRFEAKTLADGGSLTSSGMTIPNILSRAVVRESVADLSILQTLQIVTDTNGLASLLIPHKTREPGAYRRHGVMYEGEEIPRIRVSQSWDTAAMQPIKFSLDLSNEVLFFGTGQRDINALEAFISLAAEQFRETLVQRAVDEQVRCADAYNAITVSGEDISAQLDGSTSLIKSAHFPIVRPRQLRQLDGTPIGDVLNPISLALDAVPVYEWTPETSQSTGTYWILENPTLGYIRLVDASGDPVTPNPSAATLGYSRSTNKILFDKKLPTGSDLATHLNGAVTAIGAAKKAIFDRAKMSADYCALSEDLADVLTDADYFAGSPARTEGLTLVKGLEASRVNVDSDLNEGRILVGVGQTESYAVSQPLKFADPFARRGSPGKLTYGSEVSTFHVPETVRNRLTSVVIYDSDARAAAA